MKPKLAEVVTLYAQNASDIAAMLREAADNMEAGDPAVRSMAAVAELESGGIQIFGWGKIDSPRAIALFNLGLAQLVRDHLALHED